MHVRLKNVCKCFFCIMCLLGLSALSPFMFHWGIFTVCLGKDHISVCFDCIICILGHFSILKFILKYFYCKNSLPVWPNATCKCVMAELYWSYVIFHIAFHWRQINTVSLGMLYWPWFSNSLSPYPGKYDGVLSLYVRPCHHTNIMLIWVAWWLCWGGRGGGMRHIVSLWTTTMLLMFRIVLPLVQLMIPIGPHYFSSYHFSVKCCRGSILTPTKTCLPRYFFTDGVFWSCYYP